MATGHHVRRILAALTLGAGTLAITGVGVEPAHAASAGQTCDNTTCTLTFTAVGDHTWTVPAGVTSVTFTVDGAQGGTPPGGGGGAGGSGAEVTATVATTPGSTYTASVGGAGATGAGGANGGATGGTDPNDGGTAGGGGGYSALLSGETYLLVAGGGGGGDYCETAGGAGGLSGDAGESNTCTSGESSGGGGGTDTEGGAAGAGNDAVCTDVTGEPGTKLAGGAGAGGGGGGGGGGWFGGGGGGVGPDYQIGCDGSGGGGGSSHADASATDVSYTTGARSGDGQIVVSYPNPVMNTGQLAVTAFASNTTYEVGAPGVLAAASGPTALTASLESGPAHGELTLKADGSFAYTPDTDYIGDDSFTYRATDTDGDYTVNHAPLHVSPVVTFDPQGGTGSTPTTELASFENPVPPPTDPRRAGYTFDGWYTAALGGTKWDFSSNVTRNMTLYAHWATVTETVTFNSEGGSGVPTQTVGVGSPATKPADPTRSGYSFDGWYTAATGGTKWDFDTPVTSDLTLYAHWTRQQVTVTIDPRNGQPPSTQTISYGSAITAPPAPTRSGFRFAGWSTTADASSGRYDFSTPITGPITLYAQWTPITETVTFKPHDGDPDFTQTIRQGQPAALPDHPTRVGDVFDGWYTKAVGGTPWDFTTPVDQDLTLHAQWTGVTASPHALHPGGKITVTGSGFTPGEKVRGVLHSAPLGLGVHTTDATGRVTFTTYLPAGFATGHHEATLTGLSSDRRASGDFRVDPAPTRHHHHRPPDYPTQADTGAY